jgi:hypothetical protein
MNLEVEPLDPAWQATEVVPPVVEWGSRKREGLRCGTLHFYTWDYRFDGLKRGGNYRVLAHAAEVIVEPNWTATPDMAGWEVLETVGWKRRVAAEAGRRGCKVLVDLNMPERHRALALLGVPVGWRAYATRTHAGAGLESLAADLRAARLWAGTDDVLLAVFGTSIAAKDWCLANGATFVDCLAARWDRRSVHTTGRGARRG